ncbi:hypothetical protein J1N35_025620 [Gossypium stocksii]|uniref:Uncharacterized protein n=1 Tax=Gossypium stocksii TaxID=47602 RepID=A0A9D3ZXB9_9ROSI|nr:hypothetical protein J1N35_025620 [Gossypium stocksii]
MLIEETSFPVREKNSLNTSHVSDAYSFSVLPEEGNMSPNCTRDDAYSSCFLDINIEKETPDIFKSSDETVGNVKSEDKSSTERVHDAPTNRWRRYKRAASFDSRKIVLLFSIFNVEKELIVKISAPQIIYENRSNEQYTVDAVDVSGKKRRENGFTKSLYGATIDNNGGFVNDFQFQDHVLDYLANGCGGYIDSTLHR